MSSVHKDPQGSNLAVLCAVHEAGHVVVAAALGLIVEEAFISVSPDLDGGTSIAPSYRGLKQWAEDNAVLTAAGDQAVRDRLDDPDRYRELLDTAASVDAVELERVAALACPDTASDFIDWARMRALDLLVNNWPHVLAVAGALLKMGTIDEETLAKIIEALGPLDTSAGLAPEHWSPDWNKGK